MPYPINLHTELQSAIALAKTHGRVPDSGDIVVDAYRSGMLTDCGIEALHVIAELLDRVDELSREVNDLSEVTQ